MKFYSHSIYHFSASPVDQIVCLSLLCYCFASTSKPSLLTFKYLPHYLQKVYNALVSKNCLEKVTVLIYRGYFHSNMFMQGIILQTLDQ